MKQVSVSQDLDKEYGSLPDQATAGVAGQNKTKASSSRDSTILANHGEKLDTPGVADAGQSLRDEREVTKHCLEVCTVAYSNVQSPLRAHPRNIGSDARASQTLDTQEPSQSLVHGNTGRTVSGTSGLHGNVVHPQKVHILGSLVARDNSDQFIVTTVADEFSLHMAQATGGSQQLVGSMTPANFDKLVARRY